MAYAGLASALHSDCEFIDSFHRMCVNICVCISIHMLETLTLMGF